MRLSILLTSILSVFALAALSQSCPLGLSGTFGVGPTGDYQSLHAALADLHTKGLTGPVLLELKAGYRSSVETFPLAFNAVGCSIAGREVTIRPQAGAGRLSISSANSVTTFDFNNGSHFILDGRPGGTDTANILLIANSSTSGSTVRFINGASYNELRHLDVQGVTRSAGNGVVFFSGTDSATGNAFNRIDSSNISAGATPPLFGVFGLDYHAPLNKGNTVNGCNIFNVVGDNRYTARGLYFQVGYDSIIVTNNSFYQTPDLNTPLNLSVTQNYTAIEIGSGYDGGHLISGNFIGGTGPKTGGVAMRLPLCHQFNGIKAASMTGASFASELSDNTISNITWPDTYGNVQLIQLGDPSGMPFNGRCTGNILGSSDGSVSLNVTNSNVPGTNGMQFVGIQYVADAISDPVIIDDNHIGGIRADPKSSGQLFAMYLYTSGFKHGSYCIRNNVIGHDIEHNNIWWQGSGHVEGITLLGADDGADSMVVTGNHIANISSGSTPYVYSNYVTGISYGGYSIGSRRIDSNTIHDLYALTGEGGVITTGVSVGMNDLQGLSAGNFSISGNLIYANIFGTATGYPAPYSVYGISIESQGTSQNMHYTVSHNRILEFYPSDTSYHGRNAAQQITGISMYTQDAGVSTIDNNMIQVVVGPGDPGWNSSYNIFGLEDLTGNNSYLHNTVYLHNDIPGNNLYNACFYSDQPDTASTVVMNNIFAGARSVGGNGYLLIGKSHKFQGFKCDYNLLYPNGPGGRGGYFGGTDGGGYDSTLAQWQAATGLDKHSKVGDPLFVHPEGDWPDMDLHLQQGTPAESAGTTTYTTLTDIDGQLRATFTPVDIGADADNFNGLVAPPPPDTTKHDSTTVPPPSNPDTTAMVRPFPNPFSTTLSMVVNAPADGIAQITIYTLSGRIILVLKPNLIAGDNTIRIPMDAFPDGIYVVKVDLSGKHQTVQVMKKSG